MGKPSNKFTIRPVAEIVVGSPRCRIPTLPASPLSAVNDNDDGFRYRLHRPIPAKIKPTPIHVPLPAQAVKSHGVGVFQSNGRSQLTRPPTPDIPKNPTMFLAVPNKLRALTSARLS